MMYLNVFSYNVQQVRPLAYVQFFCLRTTQQYNTVSFKKVVCISNSHNVTSVTIGLLFTPPQCSTTID